MKDFAKSIVCNSKCGNADEVVHRDGNFKVKFNEKEKGYEVYYNSSYYDTFHTKDQALGFIEKWKKREADRKTGNTKVGNALKYTNLEEAKKMCQLMNDNLAPDAALRHYRHVYEKDGVYYVMETGEAVSKGMKRAGNSKVGNGKFSSGDKVKTGFGIGTVVGYKKKTDADYDFEERTSGTKLPRTYAEYMEVKLDSGKTVKVNESFVTKVGNAKQAYEDYAMNSKVGNKDIFSGNYVVVSEDGEVWFRDEHEQIGITKIDAWAQKRIAEYQRSIDEIKNGVKEAKNAAKKAGII